VCRSGKKIFTFFLLYIFPLPNIYMQIKPGGMVVGNATAKVASAAPLPA
jgi:hypothetical protein